MGVRLTALPRYLDRWGVRYELVDGWETRSRKSGDFVDVMGIGTHHTASSTSPTNDEAWCIRNSPDRPIGNGLILRSGIFRLWSVRATNTQGQGGPYLTSRGVIPLNSGNTRMFSVEAANNGVGERWTPEQIDTYVLLCCALIDCISHETPGAPLQVGDIFAHFEWAPGRKFDPAGESAFARGSALWDMNAFRAVVFARLMAGPTTSPVPPSEPELPTEEDDMRELYLIESPTDRNWYVTDFLTSKVHVPDVGVGVEGITLFGWKGHGEGPWVLGAGWGPLVDALPTVGD